jgi:hypothetical protein
MWCFRLGIEGWERPSIAQEEWRCGEGFAVGQERAQGRTLLLRKRTWQGLKPDSLH